MCFYKLRKSKENPRKYIDLNNYPDIVNYLRHIEIISNLKVQNLKI